MSNQYTIQYICSNCGHRITKELPKGVRAFGRAGTCEVCGVSDTDKDPFKVLKSDKLQILREG